MPRRSDHARPDSRRRARRSAASGRGGGRRRPAGPAAGPAAGTSGRAGWTRLGDEALLDWRIRDLDLRIEGSALEPRVARLQEDLAARGLRFRPHCWLSNEWFSPEGIPGIAIPFCLAHPRLVRLERSIMKGVEGETAAECMKILRHEAGHAIDHAYRLSRRPTWRRHFGNPADPYPDAYSPSPYSRRFVLHIDHHYAQAHPLEDFAETFAVWLTPGSRWRTRYAGWPALAKLEYVDTLMQEIADRPAVVRRRAHVDPVRTMSMTLREHYEERRARYEIELPDFYDRDLRRLFPAEDEPGAGGREPGRGGGRGGDRSGGRSVRRGTTGEPASRFLRRERPRLRRSVARWTGGYQYNVDRILQEMIERCDELELRHRRDDGEAAMDVAVLLGVHVMNSLHDRGHFLL